MRSLALLLGLIISCLGSKGLVHAQAQDASMPPVVSALLEALDAGDHAAVESVLSRDFAPVAFERRPRPEVRASLEEVMTLAGGLDVDIMNVKSFIVQARLTTKKPVTDSRGASTVRSMYFETALGPAGTADAGKVIDFTLLSIPPVSLDASLQFDEQPGEDSQVAARILQKLEDLAAGDLFSGAALLARGDRILWQAAFGDAEKNHRSKNTVHSRFHMASATKMFTGVAIGQLVEAGKLGFDTRLGAVWPDYPNQAVAEQITIGQMLTHTSGLGEGLTAAVQKADTPFRELDAAIRVSVGEPLLFEPGTNWAYSNLGYMVLGRVIELLSRMSYREYVRIHILEPAGMTETDDIDLTAVVPGLAIGYSRKADDPLGIRERHANWPLVLGFRGGSAGGWYSTAPDMLKFMRALRTYKLLGREMTEQITTGRYSLSPTRSYAYGMWERTHEGVAVRGHGGGGLGFGINTEVNTVWTAGGEQTDWTFVILSNYDPPLTQDFSDAVLRFLVERP